MREPRVGRHSLLRRLNHAAVLELMARRGELSRVELAEALTLSQASVSRIVEKLLWGGLLEELPPRSNRSGRPQVPLAIRPAAAYVATIDMRRDRYRLRLADLGGGLLAEAQVTVVDSQADAEGLGAPHEPRPAVIDRAEDAVEWVLALIAQAKRRCGVAGEPAALVVGVSAAWDEVGGRVFAARNVPYLEGVDLRAAVEARSRTRVWVENDVRLAALGEMEGGPPTLGEDFYYLSLGPGVAGADVVDGTVHRGNSGLAGEVGYLRVPSAGSGTTDLETVVGRDGLEERWRGLVGEDPLAHGLARMPVGAAEAAFRRELEAAVVAVLTAIAVVADPPVIVLGGSLGMSLEPLLADLSRGLAERVPRAPRLAMSSLGADGALVGGLRLALELAREELLTALLD